MTSIGAGEAGALASMTTANWLTLIAVVVTTVGGIVVARLTGRQNKQTAEATARDPGWGLLAEAQREEIKMLRESRREDEERFQKLESRAEEAERKVWRLSASVRDLKGRYVASVQHIKEWRVWAVRQDGPPPTLPEELTVDVDDPPVLEDR